MVERHSLRRVIAAGGMAFLLGAVGMTLAHGDPPDPTFDVVGMRHGRAIVRQIPTIHVHGPRQVPKVGRISIEG